MKTKALVPVETIEQKILLIRGQKVMIDRDLAELYGVPTKVLNQAVKRNDKRFPEDFMLQLTSAEKQKVVTICDHLSNLRFSTALPYAFTEHGAIMVASILNTKRAIEVSLYVVRAFIKLRQMLLMNKEFSDKLAELERKVGSHDEAIRSLVIAIETLMVQPESKHRKIGFIWDK